MKSIMYISSAMLLIVVVVVASSLVTKRIYAQSRRKALVYEQTEQFLTGPNTYGKGERTLHAVRGDGSSVEVRRIDAPDGTPAEMRIIVDLALLRRFSIDGLTHSVTTYGINPKVAAQVAARAQCGQDSSALRSSLLGYPVVRDEQQTAVQSNGTTGKLESRRAPDLDCLALHETHTLVQTDGQTFVTNIRDVTSIRLGEPDSALFQVPASYTERRPSDVMTEFNRRYPAAAPTSPLGFGSSKLDQVYRARTPQQ